MSGSSEIDQALGALMPEGVAAAWSPPDEHATLYPEEEAVVAGALAKRRSEFAGGRACARRALSVLGVTAVAIPSGPHREPVWPPGMVGSLTHTAGFCAAAVARGLDYRGIGLDAEPDAPLGPALVGRVCTESELSASRALGLADGVLARILFSVKEALYKCQFPTSETFLGFRDVAVELGRGTFRAALAVPAGPFARGHWFEGRWTQSAGLILTLAWDETPAGAAPP